MIYVAPVQSNLPVSAVAIFGGLFGLLTIASGGTALFGSAETKAIAGDVVGFVLWFNFLAGFLYVAAGIGLYARRQWAVRLVVFIAAANTLVLFAFTWHVFSGHAYEPRTSGAMLFRCIVWIAIAFFSSRVIGCRSVKNR